jgi:hypothetical protein
MDEGAFEESTKESSNLDVFPDRREELFVIESCHSTWVFDRAHHRYRRIVKGALLSENVPTEWRNFDRLVLQDDSLAFVVFLDASGSRVLRSWRHTARCDRCGGEVTAEMSLDELRNFSLT